MKIKYSIVNTNNCLNKVFSTFDSLNKELSFCLINTFSSCLSFYLVNRKNTDTKITHCIKLNNIYKNSLIDQDTVLIISDTSIKINIMSTEVKLFAIKYKIN